MASGEMLKEGPNPVPATQHPQLNDHLVYIIGVTCCCKYWMRTEQRHEFWMEILQGGHLILLISHFFSQKVLPILSYILFQGGFERFFIWWLIKELQRVGECILEAKRPDISKPGVVIVTTGVKNVLSNRVQDIPRKTTYLAKYCQLLHVKDCFPRQGARNKEDERAGVF